MRRQPFRWDTAGLSLTLYYLYLCSVLAVDVSTTAYSSSDPRRCLANLGKDNQNPLNRFEVLPGVGFDNLRNLDAGQIVSWTFNDCKTTEDGKFLLPDSVFIVPIKTSHMDVYAEIIDHWSSHTSSTSRSINADVGVGFQHVSISGKFSSEFEDVKTRQVEDKAMTTRVQVRHVYYSAKLQPDTPLHPSFKGRLLNIAAHLQNNNTEVARYLSQILVRDYGTHVVTSVDAGAALVKEDHVKSTFTDDKENTKSTISASASASFFSVVHFDSGFSQSTSKATEQRYLGNRTHSTVKTYGGPAFRSNFTIKFWEDGLQNELVAVDRSGDPLHFMVTSATLPELPDPTIKSLAELVQSAIELYYNFNTYPGCTKQDSPNFSFESNLDDGSCKAPQTNFTFGGVYQICRSISSNAGNLCTKLSQKNPLTGDFTCPKGYQKVLLNSGTSGTSVTRKNCYEKCHRRWFKKHCHTECQDAKYYSQANYDSYWCTAMDPVPSYSGYLFGGLYTSRTTNPTTNAQVCPPTFYALLLGTDLHICVSDDYELGGQSSLPFAGFFSCSVGNPLATETTEDSRLLRVGEEKAPQLSMFMQNSGPAMWPHRCPEGYSQHLATVEQSCQINFCVKMGSLGTKGLPQIRRPPFIPRPGDNPNSTNTFMIYGVAGKIWVKTDSDVWVRLDNQDDQKVAEWAKEHLESSGYSVGNNGEEYSTELSASAAAGIGVAATIVCGLVVLVVVVQFRKRKTSRNTRERTDSTCQINSSSSEQEYGTLSENRV